MAASKIRIGGFELQNQTCESLRECVVQFVCHPLPLVCNRQVFNLRGVGAGQLPIRRQRLHREQLAKGREKMAPTAKKRGTANLLKPDASTE